MAEIKFPNTEAPINVEDFYLEPDEAELEVGDFYDRFRYKSTLERVSTRHHSIVMKAFIPLYEQARAKVPDPDGRDKGKYVTGIRMKLGLTDQGVIEVFFQPVYMLGVIDPQKKKYLSRIYSALEGENYYYRYDDGSDSFKEVKKTEYQKSLKRYRENMRIRRFNERSNHYKPNKATTWKGHTESVMFSFHELFELYKANYRNTDPSFKYDREVLLVSACIGMNHDRNGKSWTRFKHTLLFSELPARIAAPFPRVAPLPPDDDDIANLAHLCPPSKNCDEVEYPV